jgi:tetratricopeptide (TPR) repeat protein
MSRRIQSPAALSFAAILVAACAIAAFAAVPPNLSKALEAQRRLVTERPQDPAVHNDLGSLLLLAGRADEAEQAYRKAIEIDPGKVSALFNLAQLQQQRGELREALGLYERVVKIQPGHAWAHYQMGTLYEGWKQEGRAIEHYARAFSLDPQLAFKEVNPHIVENGLVTQAMLRAYDEGPENVQAPRYFDERERIVNLLVPPPQTEAEAQRREEVADRPAADSQAKSEQSAGQTVIRPGDLENRATGQATPQGRSGRTSIRQSPSQRGLRQWNRPEPNLPTGEPEIMDPEGVQPEDMVTPPQGGVYYRPGAQSSGRSSLRVVPDEGRG